MNSTVKRIKSAYEIAMEKAQEISSDADQTELAVREEVKPLLSQFYNNQLEPDDLWEKLQDKGEDFLRETQLLILDSLGLRTTEEDMTKRKEALLAVESLKEDGQSSSVENLFKKLQQIQEKHKNDRERLEQQLENEMNNNQQMQLKQTQTKDGQTMMKMEPGLDQETRQKYSQAISETETKYSKQFSWLIEDWKNKL